MDLCRKRIVYFIVEQVAALLAYRNELAYRIVFLFKAYCCHKFLPLFDRSSKNSRAYWGPCSIAENTNRLARWRKPRGKFPRRSLAWLFE
jgi:hypothetical protein